MIFYFAGERVEREQLPLEENKGIGALYTFHAVPKTFYALIGDTPPESGPKKKPESGPKKKKKKKKKK